MSDLTHFASEIYKLLISIHPESYLEVNPSKTVVYPYQTHTFSSEELEIGSEGFYLDIDIFDRNGSYSRILALENKVKNELNKYRLLTDKALFRFRFDGSNYIATQDNELKRRNVRFYIKVDWR